MVVTPALKGVHRKGPIGSGQGMAAGAGSSALIACTIACATCVSACTAL